MSKNMMAAVLVAIVLFAGAIWAAVSANSDAEDYSFQLHLKSCRDAGGVGLHRGNSGWLCF